MFNIDTLMADLDAKYLSRAYHTFLFYLNVKDRFRSEGNPRSPLTLRQYLVSKSSFGGLPFVMQFNISRGLRFHDARKEKLFLDVIMVLLDLDPDQREDFTSRFNNGKKDLKYVLALWLEILCFSPADLKAKSLDLYKKVYGEREPECNLGLFACYLNYLQNVMPAGSSTSSYSGTDRLALESILEIAQSMKIRKARNIVVLAGESLATVASQLGAETNSIACYKVRFPDRDERKAIYVDSKKQFSEVPGSLGDDDFTRLSSAMSVNVIESMVAEHGYIQKPITTEILFEKRKKVIEEESNGLMEVQRPLWGMEAIGGLEGHKAHGLEVIENMKKGNILAVPMGMMLMGPPGTGKTVYAQALAHVAGIPFITYKNLRSMWVGESERNLSFVTELSMAQAPMIGFFDEFDEQFQARGTVFHGDSGVNARLQGKFFEFMSDTSWRGKILWIGATNMPGNIDPAMLRAGRFDDKIAFFPPSGIEERMSIFKALIVKNRIAAEALHAEFRLGDISEEEIRIFAGMCFCRQRGEGLAKCSNHDLERLKRGDSLDFDDAIYFTGGEMEYLIMNAIAISSGRGEPLRSVHLKEAYDDYIPSRDMLKYTVHILDAIHHTNRLHLLPKSGRWRKLAYRELGLEKEDQDHGSFGFTEKS